MQLAAALADRGHRVDLVLARTKGYFLRELPPSVRLVELHAPPAPAALPALVRTPRDLLALLPAVFTPGVAQVIGAIPRLARYLQRERPDAILGALDYANVSVVSAAALSGVRRTRVVASVHNHLTTAVANAERGHLRRVVPLVRHFYPAADAVVCVSEGVARDLARYVDLPPERLVTIYNPVVTPRIATLADAAAPHPWLEDPRLRVIVGVGKLRRQKDFATLLRAFATLRSTRADVRLLILGEGPEREALLRLARELGIDDACALPGFVPNPYAAMHRAAVFALSSAWEGFGNVLVEAMVCGCPVVSTDCPSGPAEILDHGRFGPLVPVGDAAALAQAIARQLDDPCDRDAAAARAREFSADASAAAYERVLLKPVA